MKRLILFFSLLLACATATFAADSYTAIFDAVTAGDLGNAEDMANEAYAQKSARTADELADLAIIYHQLTEKSSNAISRYDFVLKTIDCYKAAVSKDEAAAAARFSAKKTDMAKVFKDYSANLDKYQKAISDSMSF